MHTSTISGLVITSVLLLLIAAWTDVASRIIPNGICLALAIAGVLGQLLIGPLALAVSVAVAVGMFLVLLFLHSRGILGGGDVKLLVAAAIGLSPLGVFHLIIGTTLAGGVLGIVHLVMRGLPRPALASANAFVFHRVYVVERWRILRHAPLPYGVAIACGGIWALTNTGG